MTDKEKIKEEIKRLYNLYELANDYQRMGACSTILDFIDSLPEESGCEIDFTTKNEDLEEASDKYAQQHSELLGFDCDCEPIQTGPELKKAVIFGAEWQKQAMKEALQTEYEKGRFDMREEMMKDVAEGLVGGHTDIPAFINLEIEHKPNVKVGDKVKIIIVKEN